MASIAEQGYPDYEATLWWHVAAPAGTRLALVRRLSDDIVKGIASEVALRKIRACGAAERPETQTSWSGTSRREEQNGAA